MRPGRENGLANQLIACAAAVQGARKSRMRASIGTRWLSYTWCIRKQINSFTAFRETKCNLIQTRLTWCFDYSIYSIYHINAVYINRVLLESINRTGLDDSWDTLYISYKYRVHREDVVNARAGSFIVNDIETTARTESMRHLLKSLIKCIQPAGQDRNRNCGGDIN